MFERFTESARRVVVLAQEEARNLRHGYIGTEHLLLGLLREEAGIGARTLAACGLTGETALREVERFIGAGSEPAQAHMPFTPRAKKVLEFSLREALQLGHRYIGTEHILLALITEGEGVAAQVLMTSVDGGLDAVRNATRAAMADSEPEPAADPSATSVGIEVLTTQALDERFRPLTARLEAIEGRVAEIERLLRASREGSGAS